MLHVGQTALSVQEIVDCTRNDGNIGCAGGNYINVWSYVQRRKGIATAGEYPYKQEVSRPAKQWWCSGSAGGVGHISQFQQRMHEATIVMLINRTITLSTYRPTVNVAAVTKATMAHLHTCNLLLNCTSSLSAMVVNNNCKTKTDTFERIITRRKALSCR